MVMDALVWMEKRLACMVGDSCWYPSKQPKVIKCFDLFCFAFLIFVFVFFFCLFFMNLEMAIVAIAMLAMAMWR